MTSTSAEIPSKSESSSKAETTEDIKLYVNEHRFGEGYITHNLSSYFTGSWLMLKLNIILLDKLCVRYVVFVKQNQLT